jgi:tetratricopeptide (TPR) repeat protein
MNDWKSELDAIVGARHGGAGEPIAKRLAELDARHPNVPEIKLQLAWSLEVCGRPLEALACYEAAIALGLSTPQEHAGALVGLGNCQRVAGQADKAVETLRNACVLFPDNREFDAFLALALHSQGRYAEAVRCLITVLIETSEDNGIRAYQRSLRHESSKLA